MAIVIPANRTRYNTSPIGLGAPKKTGADFGADAFNAIGNIASQQLNRIVVADKKRKNQNDLAIVQERTNSLNTFNISGIEELSNHKGKNAPAAAEAYKQSYNDKFKELQAGLSEDQLRSFNAVGGRGIVQSLGTATSYSNQQMNSYREDQQVAYITNETNNAMTNYHSPAVVASAWDSVEDSIRAYGNVNGQSKEQVKLSVDTAKNKYNYGIISEAVSGKNYGLAKSYLDKSGDSLDAIQKARLTDAIEIGNSEVSSQVATDNIMNMGLSEKDALAYARNNYEGKERDAVVQRTKVRYGETKETRIFSDIRASQTAYDQLANGQDIDVMNAVNLNPAVRKSLAMYKQSIATGIPIQTSPSNRAKLDFLYSDNPDVFARTNLVQYRGSLSDSDFRNYTAMQNELIAQVQDEKRARSNKQSIKQEKIKPITKSSIYTTRSYMTKVSKEFGIYEPDKSDSKQPDDYKEYYANFASSVDNNLYNAELKAKGEGSTLSWLDKQKIINDTGAYYKVNVEKVNTFSNDMVGVGSITQDDLLKNEYLQKIDGMPDDQASKITEYLMSVGIAPSKENVMHAFKRGILN